MTMTRTAAIAGLTIGAIVGIVVPSYAADLPGSLAEASKRSSSSLEAGADAVVLHDEEAVTVQGDGRLLTKRRYAVRVLNRDGAAAARMREVYETSGAEIRALRGWLWVDGRVLELGRAETADLALVDNDVYNEARIRVLAPKQPPTGGMVFGGESEKLERSVFPQLEWWLQDRWPVYRVRRSLTLPRGWDANSLTLNHAPIQALVDGDTRTWSADDLQAPSDEPAGPPSSSLVPRVAVTYFAAQRGDGAFDNWRAVSRWLATLQDPQARTTPALADKARQLTATATTPLARIRAIAAHAQAVQYISIQTGIGRGGGYKPHAAADVLQKNYGDCKDKANLMRAMLATLDIPSYLVGIYAGDATYVKEEWPSPQQFNHAIIAIPVSRDTTLPAVAHSESGNSILFFDPTDEHTPLGELPLTLQGSLGLIVSPNEGRIVRMPVTAPESHARVRTIEAAIAADGAFTATMRTFSTGDPASQERSFFKAATTDQYVRALETAMRSQVPGARLTLGTVADDRDTNRFELTLGLESRAFGQGLQNGLILVGAPAIGRLLPVLPRATRTSPVVLEPVEERDRFELTIPSAFVVDELPAPSAMETPFARFEVRWAADGTRVTRTVTLRVLNVTVAASDYALVRRFLDAFRAAEGLPVVLAPRR